MIINHLACLDVYSLEYSLVASNGSLCKQSKKNSVNSKYHDCFYVADKGNYLL